MAEALIVDDDRSALQAMATLVEAEGYEVRTAETVAEARSSLEERIPDVLLTDLVLPDGRGTELVEAVQGERSCESILVTGRSTADSAVEALRLGAFAYITKPVDIDRLRSLVHSLRRAHELHSEVSALRSQLRELGRFGPLVGTSAVMQSVYDLIEKVAPTDTSVFVIGESGTGKELVAETVHQLSRRSKRVFVPLNCGAVSPGLIESELFGHEKGSFTGATRTHQGHFERASGGTLFLDEITEMPHELQVKLLRVLESGEVRRVGGKQTHEVDVRVLAATNRDPAEAVSEGQLREDLYYRLNVFPIELPPLRDRREDIEILALDFLGQVNRRRGVSTRLTPAALEKLQSYDWPGNVRELRNLVERAAILADKVIDVGLLPEKLGGPPPPGQHVRIRIGSTLEDAEKRLLLATLRELDGNKKKTAEVLGVSLKTLYNRLKAYREEEQGEAGESAE